MNILVAHSELLPLEEDWIYKTIKSDETQHEVVYDPAQVNLQPFEPDMTLDDQDFDGIIATLKQPRERLDHDLYRAHMLGKGVLAFISPENDPALFLPSFAPYPKHVTEKDRRPLTYYISKNGQKGSEASIYQGHAPDLKLKVWLGAQLMKLGQSAAVQESDFTVVTADNKRVGAEADQLPES
jgi:hypothetical protein